MEEQNNFKGKGALDAFLNLFSLITLGWMSISIGIILFQIIDKVFGSERIGVYASFSQTGLKGGIASALIITPIFLIVISSLHKHYKSRTLNSQSSVYRWLTYLVLLITAFNIIGRLIQLVYQFLNGDYTLVSILKIVVVLTIAGCIFGYYWYDLKRKDYAAKSMISQIFFYLVVAVFIASVVGGFMIVDSPGTTRMLERDQERVLNLNEIQRLIIREYIENGTVPVDLSAPVFSRLLDPQTDQPYEYKVTDSNSYELCATFELPAKNYERDRYFSGQDWDFHEKGYQCFDQKAADINTKLPAPTRGLAI